MDIKISYNSSWATFEECPPDILSRIRQVLTYTDKQIKFQNSRSFYGRHKDPEVCLLKAGKKFYTGLLPRVNRTLQSYKCSVELVKNCPSVKPSEVEFPEWLYDHQRDIIATATKVKHCIMQSPTGSGKTISMSMFIRQFPDEKILVTVPSKDLLRQTHKVLETHLGEPVGIVGGGKKEWKRVTVGIINTLSKVAKAKPEIFKEISILVCDEVHRVGANFYRDICEIMDNADYRVGFSATAWRERGDNKVLEGLIGPVALSIAEQELVSKGILVKPTYIQIPFKTPRRTYSHYNERLQAYMTPSGKPERDEVYYHGIVHCKERNQLVAKLAKTYLDSEPRLPILILVEIIAQGEILQSIFKEKYKLEVPFVHGSSPKKVRQQFLEDIKELKIPISIASRILNEGQDVPALGVGIIAGGGSSPTKVVQQVGRFVRVYPEKTKALIIDFVDSDPHYLQSNANKRKKVIKERYPDSYQLGNQDDILNKLKNGLTDF